MYLLHYMRISVQGRNEGGARGAQFTMGALNHCGGAELLREQLKSPNSIWIQRSTAI